MEVDFSTQILDFKGRPIRMRGEGGMLIEPPEYQTLQDLALMALQNEEDKIDARERNRRGRLGLKIGVAEQPVDIEVDEAGKIKELIGKAMPPLQVARAWEIIEAAGKSSPSSQ